MTRLWFRHPFRMLNLLQGYCPICQSSPPKRNCFVCDGSYAYGPDIRPELKAEWLLRYKDWLVIKK
jgi:hypothetical protein